MSRLGIGDGQSEPRRGGPVRPARNACSVFAVASVLLVALACDQAPSASAASDSAKKPPEVVAATALASGQEAEELLDELADIVRQSGRDHQETIKVAMLPAAGNA